LSSFPCRLLRPIIVDDQHSACLLFEPYPPEVAEEKIVAEEISEEGKRFFSSWSHHPATRNGEERPGGRSSR
jgi:hypothetical protein